MFKYVDWFVDQMKTKFSIVVDRQEVSTESNELYHEEVDENLVPPQHLQVLPIPFFFN